MTSRSTPAARLTIGLGLLAISLLVAVPRLGSECTPRTQPRLVRPAVEVRQAWFGHAPEGDATAFWLGDAERRLRPASPWRYEELSDGSGRVEVLLAEEGGRDARWWFEAALSGRMADAAGGTAWARLVGTLSGLGENDGALLEVREGAGGVSVTGAVDARHALRGALEYEVAAPGATTTLADRPGRAGFEVRLTERDACRVFAPTHAPALRLFDGAQELTFTAGGRFEQFADGTARLSGLLARVGEREACYRLELSLACARTPGETGYPPVGSPRGDRALRHGRYAGDTWCYYESCSGTLVGIGELAGARVRLDRRGAAFQARPGRGRRRALEPGARCALELVTTHDPADEAQRLPALGGGELCVALGREQVHYATLAPRREDGARPDLAVLALAGLGDDFTITAGGALCEQPDGSARFSAVLARAGRPEERLIAELEFDAPCGGRNTGRALGFDAHLGLATERYVDHGGPVDPSAWHAYGALRGTLRGLDALDGLVYELEGGATPLQVGYGAGDAYLAYGAWSELRATRTQAPPTVFEFPEHAEGHLDLHLDDVLREAACVVACEVGLEAPGRESVLRIGGLGDDFVFSSGGELVERGDGSVELTGIVARRLFPTQRFRLSALLGGRCDFGDACHPPLGSPRLGLPDELLVAHGGVIAPERWTYFERVEGLLEGLDELAGARVRFTRSGPAFQLGLGAHDRGRGYGGAGGVAFEVLAQPTGGAFARALGKGELCFEARRGVVRRAEEARALAAVSLPAGHALRLPGLATDLVFPDGAEYREAEDGTAQLEGVLARQSGPRAALRRAARVQGGASSDPRDGGRAPPESAAPRSSCPRARTSTTAA
ncbi:MAG: hypothetical protein H6828_14670 [Planctomycetes bacterium]|nr:hypothetical protein [Planctomycetota bacterium]